MTENVEYVDFWSIYFFT